VFAQLVVVLLLHDVLERVASLRMEESTALANLYLNNPWPHDSFLLMDLLNNPTTLNPLYKIFYMDYFLRLVTILLKFVLLREVALLSAWLLLKLLSAGLLKRDVVLDVLGFDHCRF
jgi:hypothetical protein